MSLRHRNTVVTPERVRSTAASTGVRLGLQTILVVIVASAGVTTLRAQVPASAVSSTIAGMAVQHQVAAGETLRTLGARFGIDAATIAFDNGIRVDAKLSPAESLRIDARHIVPADSRAIALIINIPQRMLFLRVAGTLAAAYPVAVGRRDWPSPLGSFSVIEKEAHPTWDVPVSIQEEMRRSGKPVVRAVPPGPENPLGDHFLRLSFNSVGIHGTPAPSSIYSVTTHGCIRLHPDDIAALFARVAIGEVGQLVYAPVLLARTADGIFLEVHSDPYRRGPADPAAFVRRMADAAGFCDEIDWTLVDEALKGRQGVARSVSRIRESPGPPR